jgi:RNA polymerase sigma-70 factor (ECF subfamily)
LHSPERDRTHCTERLEPNVRTRLGRCLHLVERSGNEDPRRTLARHHVRAGDRPRFSSIPSRVRTEQRAILDREEGRRVNGTGHQEPFARLLNAARAGDEEALEALHRRFAPAVFARVRSRLPSGLRRWYDTADIGQSVFAEVLRDLPRFEDRGERQFRHWLYLKAESKVKAKLRGELGVRGRRWQALLDDHDRAAVPAGGTSPSGAAAAAEERVRLARALDALSPAQRAVIHLRAQEGLPFADVARRLALPSPDAARVRYARALLELRRAWTRT